MASNSPEELREWVSGQLECLGAPTSLRPDPNAALGRFQARLGAGRRHAWRPGWMAWAAAAALAVAVLLLLPEGGVLAQQFWQYLTVRRVAFISVNPWPEGVPSPAIRSIGVTIPPIPARSLEEARQR